MVRGVRQLLGRGYRWWDRRWESGLPFTRGDYFIFVEEESSVRSEGLLGPADTLVRTENLGDQPWRFRCCGIAVGKFVRATTLVKPLDPEHISTADRHSRKVQLLDAFEGARLPLIDILISREDPELAFLRAALIPGSWYWVGIRKRGNPDDRLPVFLGAPEFGADPLSPRALQFLEAVPPYFEYRLRDVFSLAHVLDTGEGEDFGGEGAPPPDTPGPDDEPETERSAVYSKTRDRDLRSGEA